jgi:hypothetical protein
MSADELPNDCAVVAAIAQHRIRESGLNSRLLVLKEHGEEKAHVVVAFEVPGGGVYVYDGAGARHIPGATLLWSADAIARASFGSAVALARWQGATKPSGPNRKLSPRECRGRGLFPL